MRSILAISFLTLLLGVSLVSANLRQPRPADSKEPIGPLSLRTYPGDFTANEQARVHLSGSGLSCLGLYVFDGDGNCVARDDITEPKYCDELIGDWISDGHGRYSVTVRNNGLDGTQYNLAIR